MKTLPKIESHKLILFVISGLSLIVLLAFTKIHAANPNLAGDVNNDNVVNISDISSVLKYYGSNNTLGDANGDNTVNISDISVIITNYGKTYTGGGGGTTSCAVSTANVPDGPDPWGGCWPGPSNTGVPAGTNLTTNTGSCIITTDNAVISGKIFNCDVEIQAQNVTIKNSKINGQLYINSDAAITQYNMKYSVNLIDSEVVSNVQSVPVVWEGAVNILRSNIHGGETAVYCGDKAAQCKINDSYLHGMLNVPNVDTHLGGFHSIGGKNYELIHNLVWCDTPVNNVGGGCSGDIVFTPNSVSQPPNISQGVIKRNLMGASTSLAYCLYAGDSTSDPSLYFSDMQFTENVFQRGSNNKCGDYGPVAGYTQRATVSWTGNIWTDGTPVPPDY